MKLSKGTKEFFEAVLVAATAQLAVKGAKWISKHVVRMIKDAMPASKDQEKKPGSKFNPFKREQKQEQPVS